MSGKKGRVSVRSLCLRSGPGTDQILIKKLTQNTELTILQDVGNWFEVRVGKITGYVCKRYVSIDHVIPPHRFLREKKHLQSVELKPKNLLKLTNLSTPREKLIRQIWNDFGGFLEILSRQLRLDPAIVLAVLCVESSGKGFSSDGRMVIRFENHLFWRFWGKLHSDIFSRHFKFDGDKPWRNHRFRDNAKGRWRSVHGRSQTGEWEAFEFARAKHQRFSMYSISMGMPQIMGFNHKRIGYKSVEKMFESFAMDERNQILGLFDFITAPQSKLISALAEKEFFTFAKLFNGPGQAQAYAKLIRDHYSSFKSLKQQINVDKDSAERILVDA